MLTIEELRQKENDYKSRLAQVEEFLKIEEKEAELAALEEKAAVSVRLFSFAALVLIGIPVLAVSDLASPAAVLLYAAVYASGFGISYLILYLTHLLSREEKRKKK